ncbi:hypothetical protein HK407_14g18780 [Ordospora pajunii]|jgi:hypothetical protein|uniref:uncharacterized protein n=1 Tax=Ordospora pajunii TaxID=3039483 RepID=UPI0029527306|nr:uncharacterized protein HK407_14g18780 [Ordospora pajunii]KAH9410535.1 hypothetical protein HK407_14g18780 [Ordospora pajunii]
MTKWTNKGMNNNLRIKKSSNDRREAYNYENQPIDEYANMSLQEYESRIAKLCKLYQRIECYERNLHGICEDGVQRLMRL